MIIPDNCIHCLKSLSRMGRSVFCDACQNPHTVATNWAFTMLDHPTAFWVAIYFRETDCQMEFYQNNNDIVITFYNGAEPIVIDNGYNNDLDLTDRDKILHKLKTILTFQ